MAGRPTVFDQEIFTKICESISNGNSLRKACAEIPGSPHFSTFTRWITEAGHTSPISQQYARAREDRADFLFEKMYEIASDDSGDALRTKKITDAKTGTTILVQEENREFVQRSKLKIDVLKFMIGKMHPKYADKTQPLSQEKTEVVIRVIEESEPPKPDTDGD